MTSNSENKLLNPSCGYSCFSTYKPIYFDVLSFLKNCYAVCKCHDSVANLLTSALRELK